MSMYQFSLQLSVATVTMVKSLLFLITISFIIISQSTESSCCSFSLHAMQHHYTNFLEKAQIIPGTITSPLLQFIDNTQGLSCSHRIESPHNSDEILGSDHTALTGTQTTI